MQSNNMTQNTIFLIGYIILLVISNIFKTGSYHVALVFLATELYNIGQPQPLINFAAAAQVLELQKCAATLTADILFNEKIILKSTY